MRWGYALAGRFEGFHKRGDAESIVWLQSGCFGQCDETGWLHCDAPVQRHATPSSWFVYAVVFLTLVFGSLLLPSTAYAAQAPDYSEMGIAWGPNYVSDPSGEYGVIVVTNTNYNAALLACGVSVNDTRLNHTTMAKLSNQSTGGAFYTFAQLVQRYYYDGEYNYPNWANWGTFDTLSNLYGSSYVFWIQYTNAQLQAAKEDLQAILNGNDVGGGGGGTITPPTQDGDWVVLSFPLWYGSSTDTSRYFFYVNSTKFYFNSVTPQMHSPVYVRIKKTAYDALTSHDGWFIGLYPAGTTNTLHLYLGYVEQGALEWTAGQNDSTMRYFKFAGSDDTNAVWYENVYSLNLYSTTDDVLTLYRDVNQFSLTRHSSMQTWSSSPVYAVLGGVSGGTPDPPNNWPDDDPTPTPNPPSVPDPDPPVEPDPPTYPTQPITPYPSPPTVVEPTIPSTPDLTDILDAMANHCRHIRDAMHDEFADFDADFRTQIGWLAGCISDAIESLDGDIALCFEHLENYLYDLFHWLADQFDFSFGDYDDSSVLHYLRMIYSRLGSGRIDTRPVDPVADPFGIGEWLKQLFDNFLLDLIAIGAGDLADVIADFRDLVTKFPFSIPWDLAAMLALLVADPVTPVIQFPWHVMTANGLTSTQIRIDLSAWDSTMVPIRLMEKLAFCMLLASRSKDLLDFIRLGRGE